MFVSLKKQSQNEYRTSPLQPESALKNIAMETALISRFMVVKKNVLDHNSHSGQTHNNSQLNENT